MQQEVEIGSEDSHDRLMSNAVHWTVKYILQEGSAMEIEQTDLSIQILSGVIRESYGVPKLSAMHVMSLILEHRGEHGFAEQYIRMTREQAEKVEHENQIGIEYA